MLISSDKAYNPRNALRSPSCLMPFENAVGSVSAQNIVCYPPGIPIIRIGAQITENQLAEINRLYRSGGKIVGIEMMDPQIRVLTSPATKIHKKTKQSEYDYVIATTRTQDVPDDKIKTYIDLYREIFSNTPYSHFCFYVRDPFSPVTPNDLLKGDHDPDEYLPLSDLDSIQLPEDAYHWMDPDRTAAFLRARFAEDGYFTALNDKASGALGGFIHLRISSLENIYLTEELSTPLLLSKYGDKNSDTDPDVFFRKMNFHFGIHRKDQVAFVSSQGLLPKYRGRIFQMMSNLAETITPEHLFLPVFAEIPPTGAGRTVNLATNERSIHGIIPNGDDLVFSSRLAHAMRFYEGDASRLTWAIKRQIKVDKAQPYHSHPADNPHVEVRHQDNTGRGVFAARPIASGETIAVFAGEDYTAPSAMTVPQQMRDHCIQIGRSVFRHAAGRLAELVNHSCNPNCGIRHYDEIFAVRDIQPDEEITWDYRLTEDSDWVLQNCLCSSARCTGVVEGFDSLPEEIKREYLDKKMVSEWIRNEGCRDAL